MLDPGTTFILNALVSPAILAAVVGFVFQRYLNRQDKTLSDINESIEKVNEKLGDMKTKTAVLEGRGIIVDELRRELHQLRDDHTRTKGSVEAAWRVIDNKRTS